MERKDIFAEGEYYHLYNRGNSKQNIFLDDQDRDRFLKLLYLCNSNKNINFRDDIIKTKISAWDFEKGENLISIGAWVLMPNHFHLLVTVIPSPKSNLGLGKGKDERKNPISYFMQKVFTGYSKYFNKKYTRTGALFESNFKSIHLNTDRYLKYLFSYIHLNPVKLIEPKWKNLGLQNFQKTQKFLLNYQWSSFQDYCSLNKSITIKRSESLIISKSDFPNYFNSPKTFKKEIFEWLSFNQPKS